MTTPKTTAAMTVEFDELVDYLCHVQSHVDHTFGSECEGNQEELAETLASVKAAYAALHQRVSDAKRERSAAVCELADCQVETLCANGTIAELQKQRDDAQSLYQGACMRAEGLKLQRDTAQQQRDDARKALDGALLCVRGFRPSDPRFARVHAELLEQLEAALRGTESGGKG